MNPLLKCSNRLRNTLKNANVATVDQVMELGATGVIKLRNLGRYSFQELSDVMLQTEHREKWIKELEFISCPQHWLGQDWKKRISELDPQKGDRELRKWCFEKAIAIKSDLDIVQDVAYKAAEIEQYILKGTNARDDFQSFGGS